MLKRIRIVPVAIPLVLMGAVLIMGIVDPNFADTMTNLFLGLMHGGGWLVALGILLFIGFLVFVYIHPIGNTKFGGTDAKPKYRCV